MKGQRKTAGTGKKGSLAGFQPPQAVPYLAIAFPPSPDEVSIRLTFPLVKAVSCSPAPAAFQDW